MYVNIHTGTVNVAIDMILKIPLLISGRLLMQELVLNHIS